MAGVAWQMADDSRSRSLYLDRTRSFSTSILAHTADLRHHTGITLQAVPKIKYALRLLVDSEERELQRINNWTWEPVQPLYAPHFLDTSLAEVFSYVEMYLRHPRFASRSK